MSRLRNKIIIWMKLIIIWLFMKIDYKSKKLGSHHWLLINDNHLFIIDFLCKSMTVYEVCWQNYYRNFSKLAFLMSDFSPNVCQSGWCLKWVSIFCLFMSFEVKLHDNYSCSCFQILGILSLFGSQWMCSLIMFIKGRQTASVAKSIRRNRMIWRDRST